MDHHDTLIAAVARMEAVVEHLDTTVGKLSVTVADLQRKQDYWSGALYTVGLVCTMLGVLAAAGVQWIISKL